MAITEQPVVEVKTVSTVSFFNNDILAPIWNNLKTLDTGKIDKTEGKGLSTNDFTDALKQKLDGLSNTSTGNNPITCRKENGDTFQLG